MQYDSVTPADDSLIAAYNSIEKALKKRNYGRNQDCWRLVSFGWKDADLDREGCSGISEITKIDDESVTVKYGAHKTVCDPTYECEYELEDVDREYFSTVANEIVCGCWTDGYWSGDDWSLTTEGEATVPLVWSPITGNVKAGVVANRLIKAVLKELKGYEEEVGFVDDSIDELYKMIRMKYDPLPRMEIYKEGS